MFRHKFAFYHAWTLQNCIGGGMGGYLLSKRCVYRESRKENHQTVAQMKKFLLIILALMAKASVQALRPTIQPLDPKTMRLIFNKQR